jgi:ribosome-associated protein YbcJ (S4-like RNA binding protein)
MAQNHLFLKEKLRPEGKEFEGYTTLTGLLKSEGLFHIYGSIRYVILQQNIFQHGNIIIRRIPLTHQKHEK